MSRRMFRYVVPVDDAPHTVPLSHSPVTVAAAEDGRAVEFWAESTEGAPEIKRTFQVFGTGQPVPEDARWVGTCPRTALGLVWHLYEVREDELIGNTDARDWARRFVIIHRNARIGRPSRDIADDEETMTTWFACAIETGRTAGEATATGTKQED